MELSIARPDDWHVHFRDGPVLADVVPATARVFKRAIVMPNLVPPVTDTAQAVAYRQRILDVLPATANFEPLMTLYLTDNTAPGEIDNAVRSGVVHGIKLYPAGATTHSDAGVTDIRRVWPVLSAMEEAGLPLLVHGEVTDHGVDVFDREAVFIERVLEPLLERFASLKLVFEHVTTADAVAFVRRAPPTVAATITAHHLLMNRTDMFRGGIRPHLYCLPVLKRESHRQALLAAATGGEPKFFLGTDSAPHPRASKESACGCAGMYTAPAAIELYAEAFEQAGALDRLEAFASFHGADFYGLPRNTGSIRLERDSLDIPATLSLGADEVVPFRAGEQVAWRLTD